MHNNSLWCWRGYLSLHSLPATANRNVGLRLSPVDEQHRERKWINSIDFFCDEGSGGGKIFGEKFFNRFSFFSSPTTMRANKSFMRIMLDRYVEENAGIILKIYEKLSRFEWSFSIWLQSCAWSSSNYSLRVLLIHRLTLALMNGLSMVHNSWLRALHSPASENVSNLKRWKKNAVKYSQSFVLLCSWTSRFRFLFKAPKTELGKSWTRKAF